MADQHALQAMRASPVVDIPFLSKLKRKRTSVSGEGAPHRLPQEKKQCTADGAPAAKLQPALDTRPAAKAEATQSAPGQATVAPAHAAHMDAVLPGPGPAPFANGDATSSIPLVQTSTPLPISDDVPMGNVHPETESGDLTKLQEVISNEFNLQILMKHNELRLIEQELAKCQVALEQLRRVELRPYPGNDRLSEALSSGTGAAIEPPFGCTRPAHPAPYGVTDGPYTRHYNQWLLHDPHFDPTPRHDSFHSDSTAARSTRNSGSIRKSISKSFTFPGRPSENLQSIPNYPAPAVKDKSAPLILKRSTDNQFVKLICNNCLRGNFSSIQGFLNHCRIAHKVDYKSHDAAAIDCGRVLEEHEAANLPLEPIQNSTPAHHKPTLSRISTVASTPYRNLVHPLNTTAGATAPLNDAAKRNKSAPRAAVPSLASVAHPPANSAFVASTQTPRLSAQFAKYNRGGDLAAAVLGAKQKTDLSFDDEMLTPDTSDHGSPLETTPWAHNANGRAGMTIPGARPPSVKGVRPQQLQLQGTGFQHDGAHVAGHEGKHGGILESPHYPSSISHSAASYSPHTADSSPGLVSDHEDEDHGSASEEEDEVTHHHAEMPRPFAVPSVGGGRGCADNVEIEVAEAGTEDDEHIITLRRSGLFDDASAGRGGGSKGRKLGTR